jgi:hypothetical protein
VLQRRANLLPADLALSSRGRVVLDVPDEIASNLVELLQETWRNFEHGQSKDRKGTEHRGDQGLSPSRVDPPSTYCKRRLGEYKLRFRNLHLGH